MKTLLIIKCFVLINLLGHKKYIFKDSSYYKEFHDHVTTYTENFINYSIFLFIKLSIIKYIIIIQGG